MVWDLRYAPITEEAPSPHTSSLPHPVGERGPFVSPGTYTVNLVVDGQTYSQSLLVRGDPAMPLTADQWREREEFLVELQNVRREIANAITTAAELRRSNRQVDAQNDLQILVQQLRSLGRNAGGLASEFNGSGVRQGTLYGPTASQRDRKERLERDVAVVMTEVERLAGR
jgi:hypothetical protein